ncbi:hypothetical protein [Streptomyces melanogenes]|uniref:Uncharacterized protein n=1 Tax=Streptomyces melanogenes TaxID=67326 RepID=A0ABZ1XDR3_9ACTN|nr:hypothetical protein [Streptomyces melanogenes]
MAPVASALPSTGSSLREAVCAQMRAVTLDGESSPHERLAAPSPP